MNTWQTGLQWNTTTGLTLKIVRTELRYHTFLMHHAVDARKLLSLSSPWVNGDTESEIPSKRVRMTESRTHCAACCCGATNHNINDVGVASARLLSAAASDPHRLCSVQLSRFALSTVQCANWAQTYCFASVSTWQRSTRVRLQESKSSFGTLVITIISRKHTNHQHG